MPTYKNKNVAGSNFSIRQKRFSCPQKVIIAVIFIAFGVVSILAFLTIQTKPENDVKKKISQIASSYYEDFLYETSLNSEKMTDFDETMEEYESFGFPIIHLRQLLYHDKDLDPNIINYLKKYCNENETYVKFYPTAPYTKKSYRVEYTYSCDF